MVFALAVLRPILGLLLAVVIIVGFLCFVVVSGFRSNFLSADFYADNISKNSVYDRIYDQVLLDPEFEKQTDYLVAGVEVPHEDVVEVTRSILPPAYLQEQVENALTGALDYLKRDSEEAQVFIELATPIDNIKPTVLAYIDRRIDEIPTKEVKDAEEMADELAVLWKGLEEGEPPQTIPALRDPSSLNDSIADFIFDRAIEELEFDPAFPRSAVNALRDQEAAIKVPLSEGDIKGALKTTVATIAGPVIDEAIQEFVDEELDEDRRLDLVEVAADAGDQDREEFLDDLEPARDYIATTRLGLTLTIVAVVVGTLLLGALQYPRMGSLFRLPGIVLFISGAMALIIAIVVKTAIESLLNNIIIDEPDIPTSIVDIFSDVFSSMASGMVSGTIPIAATAMGMGLALFVVSFLIRKLPIPIFSR